MPFKYSSFLNNTVDWTDEEISAGKKYVKWEELTVNWENINLTWDEIFIILEVESVIKRGGGYGYKEYVDGNPWKQLREDIGEEKTNRVIKLFCRINGVEYKDYTVTNESIRVTAYDFELFVKETVAKNIIVKVDK